MPSQEAVAMAAPCPSQSTGPPATRAHHLLTAECAAAVGQRRPLGASQAASTTCTSSEEWPQIMIAARCCCGVQSPSSSRCACPNSVCQSRAACLRWPWWVLLLQGLTGAGFDLLLCGVPCWCQASRRVSCACAAQGGHAEAKVSDEQAPAVLQAACSSPAACMLQDAKL